MISTSKQAGFTIIELMLTIVVAGILLGIGVPAMRDMMLTQDVKTSANELLLSMMLARSEAIKRRANVELDPEAGGWADGWKVTTANPGTPPPTDLTLRAQDSLDGLTVNVTGISAGDEVEFNKLGRLTHATPTFTIFVNGNNAVRMRCVTLSLSGRPRIDTDWDGDPTDGICD